ncbi:MAG: LysR family transcriptional regulator [Elusimicrobia bacterium]|nr:LysR family transcriptional regulator [Elusimicrobiota bacterium]
MDLYQLRYFLEVARELSFTRAAENLHVSPSAASRSVALLERSLKRTLFTRTRRRVALTVGGEALKARAERVFDELQRAEEELSGEARAPERLCIGSREMITHYLLPEPLARFKERFAETRFKLDELEPAAMAAAVAKDRLDLGFYYADVADPALEADRLGRLRSHVYASKAFLRGRKRPAGIRDLLELPFIAPPALGGTARPDGFPDARFPRRIVYEADSLEAHRRFVLQGLCVGVLPDRVMQEEVGRGLVAPLEGPPIHREIWCFRRRGRVLPKAADFFVASVRRAIRAAA